MSAIDELSWWIAKWTRAFVAKGEYTDDEIVEEVERLSMELDHAGERLDRLGYRPDQSFTAHETRQLRAAIKELRAGRGETVPTNNRKPGPSPLAKPDEVERVRRELEAAGESAGERSIAKKLGVSRDAVRYTLGKDRRRPRS